MFKGPSRPSPHSCPDIVATCLRLTGALVLEGLDDVGDLNGLELERTLVLCVSTAVLLLVRVMARQNAKRAPKIVGHVKQTFMPGDLLKFRPRFPV